jgi:ABC-type branched-subunit amino acid transport system substrate-binding protein
MKWVRHGWAMLAAVIVLILMSSPRAVRAAEIGVTDKEIVVGAGVDLTGAVANWGVNIKAGMEAVFNRVNEAGACTAVRSGSSPTTTCISRRKR